MRKEALQNRYERELANLNYLKQHKPKKASNEYNEKLQKLTNSLNNLKKQLNG